MYIHAFILTYAYVCICIYFCIYLHAYLSKNEFILISPLWSSTARFILAFPLSSSSLLSLTVRNLAPIVCKLNTYLINPIMHVVSEWLIHIPMKNKILTRMLSLYFFFFLVFSLMDSNQCIISQSYWGQLFFFPSWSHLNIFKVFPHLALSLITSLLLYKGRRSHDMWNLHWFLWSCDQSDSWLELGSSGFAVLSVELLLQDEPGLQR